MSFAQRLQTIVVTTDSAGDGVGYSSENITGRVHSIRYVKTDYADGVDFTVTGKDTGTPVWAGENVNASTSVYPVVPATLATDGTDSELTEVGVYLVNEPLKIVVANGGNGKSGSFIVTVT
jgi:hypothetical protein